MSLAAGAKLGPYEIVALIGAGGMLSRPDAFTDTGRSISSGSDRFGGVRPAKRNPPQAEAKSRC